VKPETAWSAGRFDSSGGAPRLLFGSMHEDPEIELAAFRGKGRIFCIASAGTTALRLAEQHEVVACDINPTQLAYAQQRARGGPVRKGDAERAMSFARSFMPVIGWRTRVLHAFLALSDLTEQAAFWKQHLDTRRFRAGLNALMSPLLLRTLYASPFLSFLPPRFGTVLRDRLERGFSRHQNVSNPYARALLLGEAIDEPSPRASQIEFILGDAASWLASCPPRSFDGFALSNILDGAEPSYQQRLWQALRRAAADNAVVVWRSFAEPAPGLATNQADRDRSLLWGVVDVRTVSGLA
jgi:hypothetical protein